MTRPSSTPVLLALLSAAYSGCIFGDHDFSGYQREPSTRESGNESDEAPAQCVPGTCAAVKAECGVIPDGCGKSIDCGQCAQGFCGGAGPNRCGSGPCTALSCAQRAAECGKVQDGCGKLIDCGSCSGNETCGADLRCTCRPKTCAELGHRCGEARDGCGREIDCGECSAPDVCIEGLVNFCLCQALTCAARQAQCGEIEDGCGGEIDCGECGNKHDCEDNRCVKEEDDD